MKMTYFKYDIETLLKLVESKQCIWDKNCEAYKNRRLRSQSWTEIFNALEPRYSEMSREDKKQIGTMIIQKYTNVRDAFIKSLRCKSAKRRYVYFKHLQFLLRTILKPKVINYHWLDLDPSILEPPKQALSKPPPPPPPKTAPPPPKTAPPPPKIAPPPAAPPLTAPSTAKCETASINQQSRAIKKSKKPKRRLDDVEKEILAEIKKPYSDFAAHHCCQTPKKDDKETVLLSFMPYVKDMDEGEMLQLHVDILSSIWKIKQKRGNQSQSFPASQLPGNKSEPGMFFVEIDENASTDSISTHPKEEMENDF